MTPEVVPEASHAPAQHGTHSAQCVPKPPALSRPGAAFSFMLSSFHKAAASGMCRVHRQCFNRSGHRHRAYRAFTRVPAASLCMEMLDFTASVSENKAATATHHESRFCKPDTDNCHRPSGCIQHRQQPALRPPHARLSLAQGGWLVAAAPAAAGGVPEPHTAGRGHVEHQRRRAHRGRHLRLPGR